MFSTVAVFVDAVFVALHCPLDEVLPKCSYGGMDGSDIDNVWDGWKMDNNVV